MADTDASTPILRYNLVTNNVEYFIGADYYPIAVPTGDLSLPSGQLFVGNASGKAAPQPLSGAGTLSNTGVLSLTLAHLDTYAGNASGVAVANSVLQVDTTHTSVGINTTPDTTSTYDLKTNSSISVGSNAEVAGEMRATGNVFGANLKVTSGGTIGANNGSNVVLQNTFDNAAGWVLKVNSGATMMTWDTSTQAVSIGTAGPDPSAILDLQSTAVGFLPPRMSTTQKNAISSPAEGLMVYDLTLHNLYFWNGSAWTAV